MAVRCSRQRVLARTAMQSRSAPTRAPSSSAARRLISSQVEMRILLTRPEPDGSRTAGQLRARGHEVILAPLMRAEPLRADFAGPFAAALMTSANAARAAIEHPRFAELSRLPIFTVGDHSA